MRPRRPIDMLFRGWRDELTIYMRIMSGILGFALFIFGWGPMIDPDNIAYSRPIFDGVQRFASMNAWGLGFWVPAVLLMASAISGRAMMYVWGSLFAATVLCGWSYFVVGQWVTNDEAVFTTGGLALYVMAITFDLGLAFSPKQLVEEPQVVAQLGDGKVVPLVPAEARVISGA